MLKKSLFCTYCESLHPDLWKITIQIRGEFILSDFLGEWINNISESVRCRAPIIDIKFNAEIITDTPWIMWSGKDDASQHFMGAN